MLYDDMKVLVPVDCHSVNEHVKWKIIPYCNKTNSPNITAPCTCYYPRLHKMSSPDPRSVNPLFTIDERNDVRRSIAKAEAELQRLLDHQEKVMNNISHLKETLAIHRILPREIICFIFSILCAEKIPIPHKQEMTPPQITVSHVCSNWREIALATPTIWNDVEIVRPNSDEWVQVALELLFNRAGTQGVTLALDLAEIRLDKMGKILHDIVLPLHFYIQIQTGPVHIRFQTGLNHTPVP
ncbi:hypothetical protein JOM56_014915 [Amanita muscaria]